MRTCAVQEPQAQATASARGPLEATGAERDEPVRILGRVRELAMLTRRVDALPGAGGALVLSGDPGIGKTTVVEEVARHAAARGCVVLRVRGLDDESHLPYAGLHQLVEALSEERAALPAPRRRALEVAFGLHDDAGVEPFFVRMAMLELLTGGPRGRAVLLVAEDVQWLDRETSDVLAFVARRVSADPVLLLATVCTGFTDTLVRTLTARVELGPLGREAADQLLDASSVPVSRALRPRLLAWAGGNPLALVELPLAFAATGGGPWDEGNDDPVPTTARLQRAFVARALSLAAPTRAVLLVVAVLDGGTVEEVLAAATAISGDRVHLADADVAVTVGLLDREPGADGSRLLFRHALARTAVLNETSAPQLQQAHLAVAASVPDAERRAWHRSFASALPDPDLADELEGIASRAQRRGGLSVARVAYQRAAALTGDQVVRARRLLQAAEIAHDQGDRAEMEHLLRQAQGAELGVVEQCRVEHLMQAFSGPPGSLDDTARFIADASAVARAGDVDLALQILISPLQWSYFNALTEPVAGELVRAAEGLGAPRDDPWLLVALALGDPAGRARQVMERARPALLTAGNDPFRQFVLASAAAAVGDVETALSALPAAVRGLRARGALFMLAHALHADALLQYYRGDWNEGVSAAAEGASLAAETGQPVWAALTELLQARYAAVRGDLDASLELIDRTVAALPAFAFVHAAHARGVHALAAEQYEEAYAQFSGPLLRRTPGMQSAAGLSELAEAAAACGRQQEARSLLQPFEELVRHGAGPHLQAEIACCRALLARDEDAQDLFETATAPVYAAWPFLRARSELAYGSWLRRQRRINDSRPHLRAARDGFDRLGALPWGERARRELRAAGESSQQAVRGAAAVLSPQELQIATLAASGLTNRQIAGRLFLSHRTIGTHLYQAFPKLGISSRLQLAEALRPA